MDEGCPTCGVVSMELAREVTWLAAAQALVLLMAVWWVWSITALLTDLEQRGLLDRTLVVAVGEFGRTPHPNANGGRDHWPGCWSAILAGGGVQGGRVVGSSDAIASEPKDRPVTPAELVATIYHALGISPRTTIPGPDGTPVRVVDAAPVTELF